MLSCESSGLNEGHPSSDLCPAADVTGSEALALGAVAVSHLTTRLGKRWSPAHTPTPRLKSSCPSCSESCPTCPVDRGSGGFSELSAASGSCPTAVGHLCPWAWSVVLFSLGSPSTGPFGQAYFMSRMDDRLPPWSGHGCGVPGMLSTPSQHCLGLVAPWPSGTLSEA